MAGEKKKIRIAQLVNYLGRAGKEMGIVKLLGRMNKDIFDCSLIVVNAIYDWSVVNEDDYRLICMDFEGGNSLFLPFRFRDTFKTGGYDIVHTRSWVNLIDGILGAKMAGIPSIVHQEHGTFPQGFRHRRLQPVFWRWADRVLSVSAELAVRIETVTGFPAEKISVILNGVDESRFYPDKSLRQSFRSSFGFTEDEFIIGTVGRMNPVKNFPMLVRAVALLYQRGEKVRLVFTGDGERKEALEALANELNIADAIRFLGVQEDINMILNGYDIFSLTSWSEGCSNVIQEAMFAGRPVVATRVGGNPELITDGFSGQLVPSDDHAAMADAFMELKSNRQLAKKYGETARKEGLKRFSLDVMIKNYERVYLEEYLKQHPSAHDSHFGEALKALNPDRVSTGETRAPDLEAHK